ncbi:hypothetical protein [Micromonospora sp. NPDC049799]|uniref:hypothetical protein n=1 Tax=Micromonospora sp. NPDC049799 TaxID=3154741 RepID=UPI0033F0EEFF
MTDAAEPPPPKRHHLWIDRARAAAQTAGAGALAALKFLLHHLADTVRKVQAARPSPSPPEELTERRKVSEPIIVPAQGHVFTFTVHAAFTWSARGLRPDLLAWYARYFTPQAVERLTHFVAQRSRATPPHRAGELEVEVQRLLRTQDPWPYERGDVLVTCQPDAWVRLDERVRRTLQPYWERRVRLECQYEEYLRRARYAEQLTRRWASILDEVAESPGGAGSATVDEEHRRAREHLRAEERSAAGWTAELLRQRRSHQDLFEPLTDADVLPRQPSPRPSDTSAATAEQDSQPD